MSTAQNDSPSEPIEITIKTLHSGDESASHVAKVAAELRKLGKYAITIQYPMANGDGFFSLQVK